MKSAQKVLTFVFAAILLFSSGVHVSASTGCRKVLILMYHDVSAEQSDSAWCISQGTFRRQIETLQHAGYQFVTFDDLIAFVDYGKPLPRFPAVITFYDGYKSNLELAAPILAEYGISATINIIGAQVGKSTYRNTNIASIPHFSFEEALPWIQRGVIHIGHHSNDMHMVHKSDEQFRRGVLQRDGESGIAYSRAFIRDFKTLQTMIHLTLGTPIRVFAYPYGLYNDDTEAMLKTLGIRATLTTDWGVSTVERGNPDSLFTLKRINMDETLSGARLIKTLERL